MITTQGWVRNLRMQKNTGFLELGDGSSVKGLQVVGHADKFSGIQHGACVKVKGKIVQSPAVGQSLEMNLSEIQVIGECPPDSYPLQPKHHSLEFLRENAHLRTRSNTFGAMMRVRNAATIAIHNYFQQNGFINVHTPIITASDCEGGGEQFELKTSGGGGDKNQAPHFFGTPSFLTVSGQLEAEIYASSHSRVYTFGPTFRAEKSNTTRHLAEFWMIEPEIAFINLKDNLDIAEDFLKFIIKSILFDCKNDIDFFNQRIDKNLHQRLSKTLENQFIRLPYTEAVDILNKSKENFENQIEWGMDLQREHEKYLTNHFGGIPVFVIDWPKQIKPFYMRENDDNKTVSNMDLLVPEIGELIGGSIREERYDVISKRIKELGMDEETYNWYLDLRKFGSAPHGGFGLGFERFLQYITGLQNIRDVIPIPRYQNYCKF
eukprot:gene10311-12653_t